MKVPQNKSFASAFRESLPEEQAATSGSGLFEALQARLKIVEVDGQKLYVAEGDTLLDEDQLFVYAEQRAAAELVAQAAHAAFQSGLGVTDLLAGLIDESGPTRGLLGMVQNGRIVRWGPGTVLSYCVLRQTFETQQQYKLVRKNMLKAIAEWEATCGVKFQYRPAFDSSDSVRPSGVLFPVRGLDTGGALIAAAFFPNDPTNRRRLIIDPSYFTTSFDKVGVLRHELGHILGFRHEHIRSGAPPICPHEDPTGTFDLTQYDPTSVMHYFCGKMGTNTLSISALDRTGAQRVYGPPLSAFAFVSSNESDGPTAFGSDSVLEPEVAPLPGADFAYLQEREEGTAGFDESYFDQPVSDEEYEAAFAEAQELEADENNSEEEN